MADGDFDAMAAQDAEHGQRIGSSGFVPGQSVEIEDEDEPTIVVIGKEYVNRKSWKKCTVIGAVHPRRWDDRRDTYVTCSAGNAECYKMAQVRHDDGTEDVVGGHLLCEFITEARHLPMPPLAILSYDDMLAMHDPTWLVDGLIADETSALLFGKSNAFKSFLGIDVGCSVATGTDWHGHTVGEPAPVLYVATEGSRGVGKQRIPGWMEAHGIPQDLRRNMCLYPQEIALDDNKAIDALLLTCGIKKAHGILLEGGQVANEADPSGAYKLVVIDIFGASMMGPETSDETARAWVRNINRIMREMKCAVLTVAHTGWADDSRARMHTHFWGSFDTRLKAEGDKASRTCVLRIDRHKDADSAGEWGFRLDEVETPTGGTTLVPRLCDEVETTQKRRVSGKPYVALQALSEALIDHGKTIAGPNYPTCPVIEIDKWRHMCNRHGLTDSDNAETQRKTFNRAKSALIDKGVVRQFDGYVWKAKADE